jgi:hypothetical protein
VRTDQPGQIVRRAYERNRVQFGFTATGSLCPRCGGEALAQRGLRKGGGEIGQADAAVLPAGDRPQPQALDGRADTHFFDQFPGRLAAQGGFVQSLAVVGWLHRTSRQLPAAWGGRGRRHPRRQHTTVIGRLDDVHE